MNIDNERVEENPRSPKVSKGDSIHMNVLRVFV